MKTHLLLVLAALLVSTACLANRKGLADDEIQMHRALCALNRQWAKLPQTWARPTDGPLLTDADWIQHHLSLVEERLRANTPVGLAVPQKKARLQSLDALRGYRLAGRFPKNETHATRTPVFIDAHNTFCAVGFLLKESGAETLARSVAAKNNFVYLPELYSPALDAWASDHGFTRDELAWIQPGYAPMYFAASVGGGTNGSVSELLVSNDGQKMYVGGRFTHVNGSLAAPNIAYVTESAGAYTWHNIGTGLAGPVMALAEWNGKLFAGGNAIVNDGPSVGSLAFWDGTAWIMAGQASGNVHDLAVFRDTLYASGDFSTPSGPANFARWNGAQWIPINGLTGTVFTLEAVGPQLFLGGRFLHGGDTANAIRWNAENSFQPFAGRVWNEVRDFEVFRDTVYASCRFTSGIVSPFHGWHTNGTDTNLVCRLIGNSWQSYLRRPLGIMHPDDTPTRMACINTLCAWNDTLMSGGDVSHSPGIGFFMEGIVPIIQPSGSGARWFYVDSAVNKLAVFKGTLFAGGRMKGMFWTQLNGIARQAFSYQTASVAEEKFAPRPILTIHPNPVKAGSDFQLTGAFQAQQLRLFDVAGREIWSRKLAGQNQLSLPAPQAAGRYNIEWTDGKGNRMSEAIVVE